MHNKKEKSYVHIGDTKLKEMICELEKLITRNFETYRNSPKINNSFSIENFSQFNIY